MAAIEQIEIEEGITNTIEKTVPDIDLTESVSLLSIKLGSVTLSIEGFPVGNILKFVIPNSLIFAISKGAYQIDYSLNGEFFRPFKGTVKIHKSIRDLNYVLSGEAPTVTTSSILITDVSAINAGATVQLTATATLSDGSTQDVTNSAIWSSKNNSVASVNGSGLVTSSTAGAVDISATYDGQTDSTPLTVNAVAVVTPVSISSINETVAGSCSFDNGSTCQAASTYTASIQNSNGAISYAWTVTGGTIVSGQDTSSIAVTSDSNMSTNINVSLEVTDSKNTASLASDFTHSRTETIVLHNVLTASPNPLVIDTETIVLHNVLTASPNPLVIDTTI